MLQFALGAWIVIIQLQGSFRVAPSACCSHFERRQEATFPQNLLASVDRQGELSLLRSRRRDKVLIAFCLSHKGQCGLQL